MTEINPVDFKFYQDMLLNSSGLALTDSKAYLLSSRLKPVALSLGYATLEDFTVDLRKGIDPSLKSAVVEAMTTNETSFFRDTKPFDALRQFLNTMVQKGGAKRSIRILSAACSSGQECYSIAMVLQEYFADKPGWRYEIVGTDISDEMIGKAQCGEYSQFEIQRGLTIQMMMQHFEQDGKNWRVKPSLKKNMHFQKINLMGNLAALGQFDIVFCRNVLIYFNPETKARVLNELSKRLNPEGLLLLGASETIIGLDVPFISNPICSGALGLKVPATSQSVQKARVV